MPPSVLVVGSDRNLFESVRAPLRTDARFTDVGDHLYCDGSVAPLTNIYPTDLAPADWEGWESRTGLPVPQTLSALVFGCRSAE